MSKTLGQVAFEAAHGTREPYGFKWEHNTDEQKVFWQAAAEAVVRVARDSDDLWRTAARISKMVLVNEQQWAVVEAAREWRKDLKEGDLERCWDEDLIAAVEALEAEKET